MNMDKLLRTILPQLEQEWGTRPRCVLACQGGSDEHWQIFNPYDMGMAAMPRYTVTNDTIEEVMKWDT